MRVSKSRGVVGVVVVVVVVVEEVIVVEEVEVTLLLVVGGGEALNRTPRWNNDPGLRTGVV